MTVKLKSNLYVGPVNVLLTLNAAFSERWLRSDHKYAPEQNFFMVFAWQANFWGLSVAS